MREGNESNRLNELLGQVQEGEVEGRGPEKQ